MNVQLTDKKECILKNTLLLIKENGFHGTPMSQIAKTADIAIGTIYHYFPSKDALIIELYYHCKRHLHRYIFDNIDNELSYREQFNYVFKRFCTFYLEDIYMFSFFEQFHNSPFYETVRNQSANNDGQYEENKLMSFLVRGTKDGHFRQVTCHVLVAAFIGSAINYSKSILYGKATYDEKELDDLIDIIWTGIKTTS